MDSSRGGADLMLLEDFGQRVDLTRRIREILVNYPEGTTVLKELIQNADDAGATKFCLCLDRRIHGVKSLLSSKLGQWQGPALLAYNDAIFTEEDFASISRVGDSKKEGQAWKTGRFRVGFNSVYHLTDLPSFVSNKYVVLFDPHGSYLPNVSTENPGKRLEYVSSSAICLYEDQFLPYCAFGCDMKNPFHGTLFRFPLRNVDQAAVSKLSKQTYTEGDISFMFSKLYEEAVFCLLFLKSIISIEMFVWDAGSDKPHKLYSCSISPSDEKTVWHRKALLRLASLDEVFGRHVDSFSLSFLSETFIGENSEKKMDSFLVVQSMAPTTSRVGSFAVRAGKDYDLHLLPWASVAVCLSDDLPENHVLKQGQAFCFLPLPVKTGLRVHVNGYFEVSSNRRSIWFGADMDRSGKQRSDWNTLLLEDVAAPAFIELLISLRRLLGQTKEYYSFWPTGTFEEPWNILVEKIYEDLYLAPVLYSSYEGGKWISPADALFHDLKFKESENLGKALVRLGVPIVFAPSIIVDTLFKRCSNFQIKVVSPLTVRNFLKGSGQLGTLNKHDKLVFLEYCLTDLSIEDVGKHVKGLPLLPLANGEFGTFSETMQGIHYFICNDVEYELLSHNLDIVIDRTIPSDLFIRLSTIARSSQANLTFFNEENFLELFPRFFPDEWKYKNRVLWTPGVCTTYPTAAWFSLFWRYVQNQAYDISVFHEWPVFPSTSGYLYRASKSSKLVNAEKLSHSLRALLVKIGCKILDPAYGIMHYGLSAFVSDGDAGSILSSIFDNTATINDLQTLFQEIPSHEKIELRQFLLDPKWYHGGFLSDIHIKNAKKLPMYTVYDEQRSFHNLESHIIYIPPVDLPEFFMDGDFMFCSSDDEENILIRYYGVERMPKATFYRKYVLGRLGELQSNVRDDIMLSILEELPQLSMTDSSFKDSLRTLKFLPTVNGSLDCPQSLYDPRIDELYALLDKSCCFPGGLFGDDNVLDVLLGLGLRTSVSADTLIRSARHVESLMRTDQLKAYSQGKVLLSYLEVHASKWVIGNDLTKGADMIFSRAITKKRCDIPSHDSPEKFWNDLRMICWCPVLVTAPHPALPWPAVTAIVAPPKIVRLREDIWLVSASSRILDGECCSSFLSSSLGWSSPPSGSVIAAQLLELGKTMRL
ncbi:hypothetical protein HPP92_012490 [Vanilla planifolia]|uniref:Sacsin/Nov domain-containing protein n=1 Tax=Vanilla planifolia TaxID=51239 RepID=A0A835QQK8_VANPL|nr:hypothetical protein HPP92_012490 [Vanilla planifolia]